MADPLSVLRNAISKGQSVVQDEAKKELVFADGSRCSIDAETNMKSTRGSFYTVGALWFVWQHRDKKYTIYLVECSKYRFPIVSLPDRKDIELYLKGDVSSVKNLVPLSEMKQKPAVSLPPAAPQAQVRSDAGRNVVVPMETDTKPSEQEGKSAAGKRERTEEEDELSKIFANERLQRKRTSVLQNTNRDFINVVEMVTELYHEDERYRSSKGGSSGKVVKSKVAGPLRGRVTKARVAGSGEPPIIIVPASLNTPLNLYNAKSFLEDGKYYSSEKLRNEGAKKQNSVLVQRKLGSGSIGTYLVIDNVAKLKPSDWDRVIAVFALGKPWQFSGWKYSDPVDLFSHTLGCNMKFDDVNVDANVRKWNVKIYTINRTKRHLDLQILTQLWRDIDSFAARNNPSLSYT